MFGGESNKVVNTLAKSSAVEEFDDRLVLSLRGDLMKRLLCLQGRFYIGDNSDEQKSCVWST